MQFQSEEFLSLGQSMNAAPPSRDAVRLELAAEALRRFSEVRFIARGSSMLPSIYPGDCLTVRTFGAETPRCGEIVLYRCGGEFCVHRIAGILKQDAALVFKLRGDALTDCDPLVPAPELLGRVTSLERRGVSLKPSSARGMLHRAICVMIRHSRFVAPVLLRWHAVRQRDFSKATSSWTSSVQIKTERL